VCILGELGTLIFVDSKGTQPAAIINRNDSSGGTEPFLDRTGCAVRAIDP